KKDDTSLEAILSTLQISFIPAVRSPALGIMREDFTHYSLANQIGAPFYPDPPHGNGPEENPLSLRDIDQINPLLPFSYHANDTLYVRRNLNSHHDLSPMVIVTHQLPDYNSLHRFLHQVSKLSTYTQAAPLSLIIIHIPTDLQEATTYRRIAKLISDFQDENIHVNLVSLSPFHPDGFSPNEIENTATDKVFKAYWKDLLDPSHPGNAIDLAEGLFFSLFDSPRQRF
ncbi:MAG: hypothetical protein KDD55_13025, partial [Bdellovibrionales bacterium]|nr:hypothetical protein [Bdellovibrionales bacterium]